MSKVGYILKHIIPASIIRHRLSSKGSKRCVLFTFDDGPHPEITPRVLDVLDQYGARAIFFIPANRIIKSPKLIKEIINRNHEIGNHSLTHAPSHHLSFREIVNEINKCRDELFFYSGIKTSFYRPPMGIVTTSLLFASLFCKHKILRWSLDSGEYSYMRNASPFALAENFMKRIRDRDIILSHDDKDTTPDYLELVLPKLIDQGFNLSDGLPSLKSSTSY